MDENTKQWSDGILSIIMRNCSNKEEVENSWILLDGPVDPEWIENMNTALDDNKKLCLITGEIIKLTEDIRLIFEVDDLFHASPATVLKIIKY